MVFSPEEKKILSHYVTDPDGDVFCITNMQGMVGAAYARYSRAKAGFREVLLKEFISEGNIDPKHAADLIDRILIAYGDDSVGELEGAHVSFEEISILATKEIEERRIGGSPIEQSTRYVFYDQKPDGRYRYYRDPRIMASRYGAEYEKTMDFVFDTYCSLIDPMKEFYENLKSREDASYDINGNGVKERYADLSSEDDRKAFRLTYNMDLRTRACDTLRNLLPIATRTNVGIFGNGRFFQSLLSSLYSSPYTEAHSIAERAHRELNKVIPVYVKRAQENSYSVGVRDAMFALTRDLLRDIEPQTADEEIDLLDHGEDVIVEALQKEHDCNASTLKHIRQLEVDNFTVACMLYAYARHPFRQLLNLVRKFSDTTRRQIIDAYVGERETRRDRPYRAFECGYPYMFDLVTDFGTYKDLMRHRMNTQLRQLFSPLLGFAMPEDIVTAGFAPRANECDTRVRELYERLFREFPFEASYVTLHGHKVRWLLGMNDREAFHLLELRTTPQGHPAYRRVSQRIHRAIEKQSPWRAAAMKFVDYADYDWSRGDAEARQRVKERELEKKKRTDI